MAVNKKAVIAKLAKIELRYDAELAQMTTSYLSNRKRLATKYVNLAKLEARANGFESKAKVQGVQPPIPAKLARAAYEAWRLTKVK